MSEIKFSKKQIRQNIKQALIDLSDSEKVLETQQMLEKISDVIRASPEIKMVASFAAMPFEINLDELHSRLPEVSFCYPKCGKKRQMEFYSVRDLLEMKTSNYGIREPDELKHQKVKPDKIDLFLCPATAYTLHGERLGKGGGYYDRYLLRKRADAITLGVIFSCQVVSCLPMEEHDLLIDQVL
jgi:5-formyltetrahydrofolate cyclo-ligase